MNLSEYLNQIFVKFGSFVIFSKLSNWRMDDPGKIIIGASMGMIGWYFYKAFFSQSTVQSTAPNKHHIQSPIDRTQQLNPKLLAENLEQKMQKLELGENPTIEQCKQALSLAFCYTLNNLRMKNEAMKAKRNKIKRGSKVQMQEYLNFLIQGVQQSKSQAMQSKRKSYELMRTNHEILSRCSSQLASFKQQLRQDGITSLPGHNKLTLKQCAQILHELIRHYKENGVKLCQMISDSVVLWPAKNKQLLFKVLSLVVIDESLSGKYSDIDEMQIQIAKKMFHQELHRQLSQLQNEEKKFYENLQAKIYDEQ